MTFNGGHAYHGSDEVVGGKLTGKTGKTDYFFFLCPKCEGEQVMRILDYDLRKGLSTERNESKDRKQVLNVAFHLFCPVCQFEDFIKIDNDHPAGKLS